MARTAAQLTVARNEIAAETIAATILDLLTGAHPATARDASAYRLTRKHALELFEVAGLEGRELDELTNAARPRGLEDKLQLNDLTLNGQGQ